MAQNISYASNDSIIESLLLHNHPFFGEHGDGIINTNALLTFLKQKKRFRVMDGGQEIWEGLLDNNSSNPQWQAHTAPMLTNLQDPNVRLRFEIQTFTNSLVVNKLHEAQNKGRAMIKNFVQTLREQANATIKNQFNSAFWKASPGTNEPHSIPQFFTTTPTTGTIGGLTRSTSKALQHTAYTTAVTDIGAEGGISILLNLIFSLMRGARDQVDLIIMTNELFASFMAFLETQRRYQPNTKMADVGFPNMEVGGATVVMENMEVRNSENTIGNGYIYGINSSHLKFNVLKDGNFKWANEFKQVGTTLNRALYFWVFGNLSTNLPAAHFVMSSVSGT